MAKQRKKSRWAPIDRAGALSLMNQTTRAFLRGQPSSDPAKPPTVLVEIPTAAANYLIAAFAHIAAGVDANEAMGLNNKIGTPGKDARNALLAIKVDQLRATGTSLDDALLQIGPCLQFKPTKDDVLSLKTLETAYRNAKASPDNEDGKFGQSMPDFYNDIKETFGEESASEFLDYLHTEAAHLKNSR